MANLKLIAAAAIVSVVLSLGVSLNTKPAPVQVTNNIPPALGGVSPVLNSNYFQFGGVNVFAGLVTSLNSASTTLCSIQSPAATSTLVSASIDIAVSTSSSYILTLARATTPAASTTPLISSASISSGAKTTLVASSTGQGSDVWAPNTWLNATVRGGSGGVTYPFTMGSGSCHAKWEQVSYNASI